MNSFNIFSCRFLLVLSLSFSYITPPATSNQTARGAPLPPSPWQPLLAPAVSSRAVISPHGDAEWQHHRWLHAAFSRLGPQTRVAVVPLSRRVGVCRDSVFTRELTRRRSVLPQRRHAGETGSRGAPEHLPGHHHSEVRRSK